MRLDIVIIETNDVKLNVVHCCFLFVVIFSFFLFRFSLLVELYS